MASTILKPGQGYWTRVMSAIAYALLALMGGIWLGDKVASIPMGDIQPIYLRAGSIIIVFGVACALIYRYIGRRPRTVDFMIATEGEMKKVNWSTRREILGMTWVVIGLTIFIALVVTLLDFGVFGPFFQYAGVIESAPGPSVP